MPFQKGKSGNPEGRKKGSKNKRTELWNDLASYVENDGAHKVKDYLNSIKDPAEHYDAWLKVLNYIKPKIQATSSDVNVNGFEPITGIQIINEDHSLYPFLEALKPEGEELSEKERIFNPADPLQTFRKILNDEK